MPSGYEEVQRRFRAAKTNKSLWEHTLRECYRYALPERNTIDKWSPGQNKRSRVYDDTAIDSLEDYANKMTANLVPSNTNWIKLVSGTDVPTDQEEKVDEFLEETTEVFFEHLNSSNFTSQVNEAFLDLGISTGAIICESGNGIQSALNFRAISLSELILERSSRGLIETVFREFRIPVKDIRTTWRNARLTESLEFLVNDKPTVEATFIEGVVENNGTYRSILMYPREKAFLIDEELDYNPYVIFRESAIAGEVYGRGRVMRQLNNIKTLNRMVEDYLKGLSFQANPIFLAADDGVINPYTTTLAPGVVMPVGTNDNRNPTLQALQLSGNPQLMDFAIKNYQDQIRRALLSKPFGNIDETPVRTATEMSIRNADNAASTLAASSRIQNELLERIVANSIIILKKAGKVADFKVNGKEAKIKFVNPSTRQQDEGILAAYGRFMEFMAVLPPDLVAQKFRVEDLPVEIADNLGLPSKMKRNEEEIAEMQQEQAALAEQQAQVEQQGVPIE